MDDSTSGRNFRFVEWTPETGPVCGTCGDRLIITATFMDEDSTPRPWWHHHSFRHTTPDTGERWKCYTNSLVEVVRSIILRGEQV